ncbi:cell wall hydrolase [Clostridium oryzae]|uniref:Spore cortex-lytic enzyme n=1 Tax=Clostridium oryzae TaxID=1450648 RepID=A0A1V4INR3_9CLOT|nr:cell wall hydrolase [Clostridium oryzae]OPJ61415.1 spore cortex-lytic enzyme precursor [Clostridium oryzae]
MKKFLFTLVLCFTFVCFLGETIVYAIEFSSKAETLYKEKKSVVEVFNNKNQPIKITVYDIKLMAQIVYAESRSEPYAGKVAVASVIINRLLDPHFPKTVEGVIKQKGAFSCVVNGRIKVHPTKECYLAVYSALEGKDPTKNAVFYYNPKIATSKWMLKVKKADMKSIGNHVFFVVKK